MGFVQRRVRLEDFNDTPYQEGMELLKLTFENGNALFLSGEGSFQRGRTKCYKVHPDFMPTQLQNAVSSLRADQLDEASVGRADVGFRLTIYIGDSRRDEGECETAAKLINIEPCHYRDAHPSDLQLDRPY